MAYGLLNLPAMPEVKHNSLSTEGFVPVEGVNLEDIKYRDKSRQKQREKNMKAKHEAKEKEQHKSKPVLNRPVTVMKKKTAKKRRAIQSVEDEDEINTIYKLMRKQKKGKINESEFDKLTATDDLL